MKFPERILRVVKHNAAALETINLMFSPSAIADFLACKHLTALNRAAKANEIKKPYFADPGLELLKKLGLAHEQRYLRQLTEERGLKVVSLPEGISLSVAAG